MAKRTQQFQTIRTEGAILPPDILRRIASLKVDGVSPGAYHLPPGSKLNEAISQSWTLLLNHWRAFQEARGQLPEDETGTAVTNEKWLLPLFKELDYGRLVSTKSPEIDERTYPIERFYNHTPIHLIGCNLPLDRRTKGARGAATASPHSMVQEYLNRSDVHLWAFLSNGLLLRILRDNVSLSRQAYVEFDLEAMMEGEVYADFALLWLLCHQSRVETDKPEECWLEKWSGLAREQGTRVLNDLRIGVQNAIEGLGRGFIGHPRNDQLRDKLRSGSLTTDDYYRQLLRTVYRLLFLFVAEDRELLHPPNADAAACRLYDEHYSTRRLRDLALRIRGSKHADLWHSLSLVFDALGRNDGRPELGLCGLGSFLWRASSTADLLGPGQPANGTGTDSEPALITNDDLLQAIRALAYVEQDRTLRTVDYRNLGSEELGSVYESLLELHPVMNAEAKAFDLKTAAGNERKTTGSYYTPDSLVQCLLDSALDPVVEERLGKKKGAEAEAAILDLKVCDPACGSGHFLIAAAHRLARHLARIRTGESEPNPEDHQRALRDVIGRCVYGVDINPMAVELCKVSLWIEALEPGKPLSFLDHHIQCGNSLLGVTPALLAKGIPDDAFKPIEGDDKAVCSELKKRNKDERKGQGFLFDAAGRPWERLGNLATAMVALDAVADDTLAGVQDKQRRWQELVQSSGYLSGRLLADAWCAAFVWRKTREVGDAITESIFRRIERNPHDVTPWMREEIKRLAKQYNLFHWHLAFPDVFRVPGSDEKADDEHTGWNGGFDVTLGNPPWVRQEFLKSVKKLLTIHRSFTSTADLSVLFLELAIEATRKDGFVALLTPNKWFRSSYAAELREVVLNTCKVGFLADFGHSKNLFPEADTFPAAIVLRPLRHRVKGDVTFRFVKAHDSDRVRKPVTVLMNEEAIDIPHAQLLQSAWQLEHPDIYNLLCKLLDSGVCLREFVGDQIYSGVKSGFNDAFYVDQAIRDAIVDSNREADCLLKPFLRGRDMSRWRCHWEHRWHIVIPSSQNKTWPWSNCKSEDLAEGIFSQHYPLVHAHLTKHKDQLIKRSDKGTFWWELRACDYYEIFDKPKILVQCIAYDSQFLLDQDGFYINNSSLLIPSGDPYLLAVLNSRVMWWIINRTFQHMKDDAVSMEIHYLEKVPIPNADDASRARIEAAVMDLFGAIETGDVTEVLRLDTLLSTLIESAFQLTELERQTLINSLPPRDPLDRQGSRLADANRNDWPTFLEEPIAKPIVVRPAAAQVERGRAIAYTTLLLRSWAKPVARTVLEPALILMLNDVIRKAVLGEKASTTQSATATTTTIVAGMNQFLSGLEANDVIAVQDKSGQQFIAIGSAARPMDEFPEGDKTKAAETIKAVSLIGESRALTYVKAMLDEAGQPVPTLAAD